MRVVSDISVAADCGVIGFGVRGFVRGVRGRDGGFMSRSRSRDATARVSSDLESALGLGMGERCRRGEFELEGTCAGECGLSSAEAVAAAVAVELDGVLSSSRTELALAPSGLPPKGCSKVVGGGRKGTGCLRASELLSSMAGGCLEKRGSSTHCGNFDDGGESGGGLDVAARVAYLISEQIRVDHIRSMIGRPFQVAVGTSNARRICRTNIALFLYKYNLVSTTQCTTRVKLECRIE